MYDYTTRLIYVILYYTHLLEIRIDGVPVNNNVSFVNPTIIGSRGNMYVRISDRLFSI